MHRNYFRITTELCHLTAVFDKSRLQCGRTTIVHRDGLSQRRHLLISELAQMSNLSKSISARRDAPSDVHYTEAVISAVGIILQLSDQK